MAIKQWQIDKEVENVGKASPYYGQHTGAQQQSPPPPPPDVSVSSGSLGSRLSGMGKDLFSQAQPTRSAGLPNQTPHSIAQLASYTSPVNKKAETVSREAGQMLSMIDTIMGSFPKRTTPSTSTKGTAPDFSKLLGGNFNPEEFARKISSNNIDLYTQKKGVTPEQWEIPGQEQWRMTQDFQTHGERAIDVRANQGSPIPAPVFGKVVATDQDYPDYHWSYGNMVVIEDPNGVRHLIAHMDGPSQYRTGDTVWPGDIVGAVGNSGRYIDQGGGGYHIHYEAIDPTGNRIDPTPYAQGYYIQPTSGYYAQD